MGFRRNILAGLWIGMGIMVFGFTPLAVSAAGQTPAPAPTPAPTGAFPGQPTLPVSLTGTAASLPSQTALTPLSDITGTPLISPSPTPTNNFTPAVTSTPTSSPTASVTITAGPSPTPTIPPGVQPVSESGWAENPAASQAIPLGKALILEKGGDQYSIQVVGAGQANPADDPAPLAPEGMKWFPVRVLVSYIRAEKPGRSAHFFYNANFNLVSRGRMQTGGALKPGLSSLDIDGLFLSPGQSRPAQLGFMDNWDDPSPALRLSLNGEDHFFSLTREATIPEGSALPLYLAKDLDSGSVEKPVPVGTGAYLESGGSVYRVTVKKVLRGADARQRLRGFGFTREAAKGMEYILPFIEVQAARAGAEVSKFSAAQVQFSGTPDGLPTGMVACPAPCLQDAALYPGGTASGWVPVEAAINDKAPLMAFDGSSFFSLDAASQTPPAAPGTGAAAIRHANQDSEKQFAEMKVTGPVYAMAFTKDDRFLVTAGDDKLLHVWDAANGAAIGSISGHTGSIRDISLSMDGRMLASMSPSGEILVWDTLTWQLLRTLRFKGSAMGVKFLPDGSVLAVDSGGTIKIWDLDTGHVARYYQVPRRMHPNCLAGMLQSFDTSHDGSVLAASLQCGYMVVWKWQTNEILSAVENNYLDVQKKPANASAVSLSPDGLKAAYGSVYNTVWKKRMIYIVDLENKKLLYGVNPVDYDPWVVKVAPSKSFTLGAAGYRIFAWWPEVFSWNEKHIMELVGHHARVTAMEFSGSGEVLATADYGGKILLWKGSVAE